MNQLKVFNSRVCSTNCKRARLFRRRSSRHRHAPYPPVPDMDNELKIFLQSFKELENLFEILPLNDLHIQRLKSMLSGIQANARSLAMYDAVTHALNARATKWLIPSEHKG